MYTRRRVARPPREISPAPFVGMALMAGVFFLYGASALVAPWWAVTLLMLVWVALLVLCLDWWTRHPTWLTWVAIGATLLWFAVLVAGGAWLGWSTSG